MAVRPAQGGGKGKRPHDCVEKLPPARIVGKVPVCKATIYKWVAKFEVSKQDYDIRDMKQRNKKVIVIDSDAQKENDRLRKNFLHISSKQTKRL